MSAVGPALELAARGWPVLPAEPFGKRPVTRHGVKDASVDPDRIRAWFRRWPDANLAVACGHPGPQVLDIDDPIAARAIAAELDGYPAVATARGRHIYMGGTAAGTVALPYGEIRGRGSYVLCPPSIHPSGREYVWLHAPNGPLPLVPACLTAGQTGTAGAGEHQPPPGLVPYGQRHPYLRDFAVRLARAGVTDQHRLLAHLQLELQLFCEPLPPPAAGALEGLAVWAASSRIAERERGDTALPAGAWWMRSPDDEAHDGG